MQFEKVKLFATKRSYCVQPQKLQANKRTHIVNRKLLQQKADIAKPGVILKDVF